MKKCYAMIPALLFLSMFGSCKDDKRNPDTPVAPTIEGRYSGELEVAVSGMNVNMKYENVSYIINATGDNAVTVITPAFTYGKMELPSLTLEGVSVVENEGKVILSSTEITGTVDADKNYICTLSGVAEESKLQLTYNLQYGAMPFPLICTAKVEKDK